MSARCERQVERISRIPYSRKDFSAETERRLPILRELTAINSTKLEQKLVVKDISD